MKLSNTLRGTENSTESQGQKVCSKCLGLINKQKFPGRGHLPWYPSQSLILSRGLVLEQKSDWDRGRAQWPSVRGDKGSRAKIHMDPYSAFFKKLGEGRVQNVTHPRPQRHKFHLTCLENETLGWGWKLGKTEKMEHPEILNFHLHSRKFREEFSLIWGSWEPFGHL